MPYSVGLLEEERQDTKFILNRKRENFLCASYIVSNIIYSK